MSILHKEKMPVYREQWQFQTNQLIDDVFI